MDATESETKPRDLSVRLARDAAEVEAACALRFAVFNLELSEGQISAYASCLDTDRYDAHCDHLIVLDGARGGSVVGTYRLLRSEKAAIGFYSENEFDMAGIKARHPRLLELGRSCVHRDYRDGSVIGLLWRGIADYTIAHNCSKLFGCASVHSTQPADISEIYAYIRSKDGVCEEEGLVAPRAGYALSGFDPGLAMADSRETAKKVPTLIKAYLRAGAKVYGRPALDAEFGTVDFFMLFEREAVVERYGKKYYGEALARA